MIKNSYKYLAIPLSFIALSLFILFNLNTSNIDVGKQKAQVGGEVGNDLINLAFGKSYTFSIEPNYTYEYTDHVKDPDDYTQLTDGRYANGGTLWLQKETVSWAYKSPIITIDLGEIKPIAGISFNTAAGASGVYWPTSLDIFVSDNGSDWYFVGDLIRLDSDSGSTPPSHVKYTEYRYKTTELSTHGRYVRLITDSTLGFIFVDEIEVYKGSDDLLNKSLGNSTIGNFDRYNKVDRFLYRRLQSDLVAVKQELNGGNFSSTVTDLLKAELNSISQDIVDAVNTGFVFNFSTIFPINDLHQRIFNVQASMWREMGFSEVVTWSSNRYDMLSPTSPPLRNEADLSIDLMSGEYRSDVLNLSNPSNTRVNVTFSITDLPEGTNPSYITVYEVPFTDTRQSIPIASALQLVRNINGQYTVSIPSGLTRQIWFLFNPVNIDAGTYSGQINLNINGTTLSVVPVNLKIWPLQFPTNPSLHLGGWDYTDTDTFLVTSQNRGELIKILRDHFVDSPWATKNVMPTGLYDSNGHMTTPPNSQAFRLWLDMWPNSSVYFVFSNVNKDSFAGFPVNSVAFKQAVKEWISWWVVKIKEWGIEPSQLRLLLIDEPITTEQFDTIVNYAKIIRSAEPDVVIWETATIGGSGSKNSESEMFNLVQGLSPGLMNFIMSQSVADFYINLRNSGHELWFYQAGNKRSILDPYMYDRLPAWFAWKYKAKGIQTWSLADTNGASSWNEYFNEGIGSYSPLFIDSSSVTNAKGMEAIREGVEDFEYMRMLNDKVVALENIGSSVPEVTSARTLLNLAADRVISIRTNRDLDQWNKPKDRGVADSVRLEILNALVKLSAFSETSLLPTPTPDPSLPTPTPNPNPTPTPTPTPPPPPGATNGLCATTLNSCRSGSYSDTEDTSTKYNWSCLGLNGGYTASCSLDRFLPPINNTPPNNNRPTNTTTYRPGQISTKINYQAPTINIPTTTVDISMPELPSWLDFITAFILDIANDIIRGVKRTGEMVGM